MDGFFHCANCTERNVSFTQISPVKFKWSWNYNLCSTKCTEEIMNKVLAYYDGNPICSYPGCSKTCYKEPDGRILEFCGRNHGYMLRQRHFSLLYKMFNHPQLYSALHKKLQEEQASQSHDLRSRTEPPNGPIHFYNRDEPYYEFTNFARYPIVIDGVKWATNEHFFQAQKFISTPLYAKIQRSEFPREAFEVSRSALGSRWIHKDWSDVKMDVMKLALRAKFTQHEKLHDMLVDTGDRPLVEHTSRDNFWGDGGDGSGDNHLGRLLEEVRDDLKNGKLKLNFNALSEIDVPPYARWYSWPGASSTGDGLTGHVTQTQTPTSTSTCEYGLKQNWSQDSFANQRNFGTHHGVESRYSSATENSTSANQMDTSKP